MIYLVSFILSAGLAVIFVPLARMLAFKIGAVDRPEPNSRHIHKKVMPRTGGVALYLSFLVAALIALPYLNHAFWGMLAAVSIVAAIGLVDDIRRLNPWVKLVGQLIAAAVAVHYGIKIVTLSNLSGGYLSFDQAAHEIRFIGLNIAASTVATALSLLWLVGMTNTVNFLDGLDGLAAGVTAIAAIVMFALSLGGRVNQPYTAQLAILLAGSCVGYLFYNFYPAKIFNGDSGAYFLGMSLGVLAIISGAKLATMLLVFGLPVVDAVWVILRRTFTGHSPFRADRGHLHHLLLDAGLTQVQAVLLIYAISIAFGIVALISGTTQKVIGLVGMVTVTIFLLTYLRQRIAHRVRHKVKTAENNL